MASDNGQPAPLIDALHRLLWLMERHPSGIPEFLRDARPNTEEMRLVAQALAGPALKGGELGEVATGGELAALTKLTATRSVIQNNTGNGVLTSNCTIILDSDKIVLSIPRNRMAVARMAGLFPRTGLKIAQAFLSVGQRKQKKFNAG